MQYCLFTKHFKQTSHHRYQVLFVCEIARFGLVVPTVYEWKGWKEQTSLRCVTEHSLLITGSDFHTPDKLREERGNQRSSSRDK